MPEKSAPKQTGEAGNASFVDKIVADPKNVPDVMLLYGYSGASSEEGCERLYLTPDLANFVEIPVGAILHRVSATKEQDPNGGITLWVRQDASLTYKMAPAAQALAHFFAGAIQAQGAAPARPTPALTLGGPACGVTLPHLCQIATAVCTLNTCGAACTAAGPCLTRGADCQTQADTCACTDFGCQTEVTPCINTHAVTCGACPSMFAACQSAFCQSAGADCTFIGCGHTLACTQGLLCRGVAAQAGPAATVGGPQCGVTRIDVCQVASVACTVNTCGIVCTAITPCVTHVATCQPCASVNPTCAPFCTRIGPCPTNLTCPTPCTNITPCISVVHPNCQTPFVPCLTPACTGPLCAQPAVPARVLPTMFAHCTQVCTQMQMGCGGQGCPGGTIM